MQHFEQLKAKYQAMQAYYATEYTTATEETKAKADTKKAKLEQEIEHEWELVKTKTLEIPNVSLDEMERRILEAHEPFWSIKRLDAYRESCRLVVTFELGEFMKYGSVRD
jgi:hypothetical protein